MIGTVGQVGVESVNADPNRVLYVKNESKLIKSLTVLR